MTMTDPYVLLVDSDAEARSWLIESVLRHGDHAFVEAASLSEARAHIQAQPPQVVILERPVGS